MQQSSRSMHHLGPAQIVGTTCSELKKVGSEIRRMFLLGQQLREANPALELFDLTLGNPDLEPPPEVLEALKTVAADNAPGLHRYMDNAGFLFVREAVASFMSAESGHKLTADNVFMTAGAAGAIQLVMRLVLDPGDEVVLFSPYFPEYLPYAMNFQAKVVVCPSDERHQPDLARFAQCLSDNTKLVLLNSPNNPTGVVYSKETLISLFEILRAHRHKTGRVVHVLSDEPYNRLCFDENLRTPLLSLYDCLWIVRSHSKDLGLAGERIGYLVWGEAMQGETTLASLRAAARALGFVNAPAMAQRVLPHVLHSKVDVAVYRARVEEFVTGLTAMGLICVPPQAGFFVFPKSPVADERVFLDSLAQNGVLCVAGSSFGKAGYLRCSLTCPSEAIPKILNIFRNVVENLAP